MTLRDKIDAVKHDEAYVRFHQLVKVYGSARNVADALDCRNGTVPQRIAEAIKTIAIGIQVRIYKVNGEVVIEPATKG